MQELRRAFDPEKRTSTVDFSRALTPRRSGHLEEWNYERLEFLGDSVLKVVASLRVFYSLPTDLEGVLSSAREEIITNLALCNVSFGPQNTFHFRDKTV